jgi:FMN reductase
MRPLFAFLRAVPMPTSIFAAPEDWSSPELTSRIDRAATELTQFLLSGVGPAISDAAWRAYDHQFGGNATRAERTANDINLDTDLMRLAAGGAIRQA